MRAILPYMSNQQRPKFPQHMLSTLGLCLALSLLSGCGNPSAGPRETPTSGTLRISIDESFKPIIDSQIKVFESSFPDVHIVPEYKPEAECLKDLTKDSTRMVIVTRPLTRMEERFYVDSFHLTPAQGLLALDAVAVLINNKAPDSIFQRKDI